MYFLLCEESLNNNDSDQVMVNNSTDINQQNKQPPLTSNISLNKKRATTYGLGNPNPVLGQAQICDWV